MKTKCDLYYQISEETTFILMLRPRSGQHQWVAREKYQIEPNLPIIEFTDPFGNLCQRLIAPKGQVSIKTSQTVTVPDVLDVDNNAPMTPVSELPEHILPYLLPSRYCESDKLGNLAWQITTDVLPGYSQVLSIQNWITNKFAYVPGSSNFPLSAEELCNEQVGVCRDFAHLGIALCRGLSIPARIVVGYLHELEPMDLHAWFEAYLNGRWYTFDATQSGPKAGRIAIAYGRDAADVAVSNQFGPMLEYSEMIVNVKQLKNPPK